MYREHGVVAPGPINHVDDLFVITYFGLGAVIFLLCLPSLIRTPVLLAGLTASGLLLAAGTSLDALGSAGTWTDAIEEAGEAIGAVLLAAVFAREVRLAGAMRWPLATTERGLPQSARYQH